MDGLADPVERDRFRGSRKSSRGLGHMVFTSWSRIIFPSFFGGISAGTNQSKHGF